MADHGRTDYYRRAPRDRVLPIKALRRHLSYANVIATIALFVALGGGAYALSKGSVKSRHIANDTIKSQDVKNRTLRSRDINQEALGSGVIREDRLQVSQFANLRSTSGSCDPSSGAFVNCATLQVHAVQRSRILVVVTGTQQGENAGATARGQCKLRLDGADASSPVSVLAENIGGNSGSGLGLTKVSNVVPRGDHVVAVVCAEEAGEAFFSIDLSAFVLDAV